MPSKRRVQPDPRLDDRAEEEALARSLALWKRRSLAITKDDELSIEKRWVLFAQIDKRKFIYFYDKYVDRITRYVFHRVGDQHVTEDLVSKTFFHALNHLGKFRWQGVTFGAWLYRIASNEVRAFLRNRRYWHTDESQDIQDQPYQQPDQLEDLIASENKARITHCLNKLDEKSQDVLVLSFWESLSTREISAILNMPEGTVKVTKMRARQALYKLWVEESAEEAPPLQNQPPRLRVLEGKKHT